MKIIAVFILLIYWSLMISVPVMDKNSIKNQNTNLKEISKEEAEKILKAAHDNDHNHDKEDKKKDTKKKVETKSKEKKNLHQKLQNQSLK